MASIRQYQRRAIEGLRYAASRLGAALPEPLTPLPPDVADREFSLDGQPVYPCGVSRGHGTCAAVPGMDVLVFGRAPGDPAYCGPEAVRGSRCAYAVLEESDGRTPHRTVHLLLPVADAPAVNFIVPAEPDCSSEYEKTIT